jgi:hypothetical protein
MNPPIDNCRFLCSYGFHQIFQFLVGDAFMAFAGTTKQRASYQAGV